MSVNGDTGEVINTFDPVAQYRGTHLDADKALDCGVALAYFIRAFAELTDEGRQNWLNAWSDDYRFELVSLIMSWGANGDFVFHLSLDAADVDIPELNITLTEINNSLSDTPFIDQAYRVAYEFHLSRPMMQMQQDHRDGKNIHSDDDGFADVVSALLEEEDFAD